MWAGIPYSGASALGPGAQSALQDVERLVRISDVHLAADNPVAALEYLEEAEAQLAGLDAPQTAVAGITLRMVDCLRRRGDLEGAQSKVEEALDLLGRDGDPLLLGKFLSRSSAIQAGLGEYETALRSGKKAYELLRASDEHAETGLLDLTLGTIYWRRGQVYKSRECFESALFAFRRIDHREGIARALNNLGLVLKNGPRWADARDFLTRALAVSEEAGNYGRMAAHCSNLGILYTKLCDWELAEQFLSRAISIHKEVGNTWGLAKTLLAMGHLRRRRGQRELAASQYAEARRICEEHSYGRELALCFEAEGDLLSRDGRLSEARCRHLEGLELAVAVAPGGDIVPEIKRRLAAIALAEGEFDEARRWAAESARAARKIGDNIEAGAATRILGEALSQKGQMRSGGRALERSLEMLSQTPERLEQALSQLALARHLGRVWKAGDRTEDNRLRERAIELMREAWAFLASAELIERAAEALVELAGLRFSFGKSDEALRDIARAHALAEQEGRQDLLRRLESIRGRVEEQSAEEALLTSPEVDIIEGWTRLFSEGKACEACLDEMLRFAAERLQSNAAFIASPVAGEHCRIEASMEASADPARAGATWSEAGKVLEVLSPFLDGNRICLATDLAHDPRFALHSEQLFAEVRSFAALSLALPEGRGVLYVDRRGADSAPYGMSDLRLLSVLSGLLGLGLVQIRRERVIELQRSARVERAHDGPFADYITAHAPIRELFSQLERVGDSTASILVLGETGTGKGLLAQCIHKASSRAGGPFVTVNCAALPEPLLESELFGHVQGSFTGAHRTKRGLFEEAEGGTLFLDEISRPTLAVQAKLLQVLDSHEIRPVGSTRAKNVDVRIICASNVDLREAIGHGRFLEDLFYRLNDFTVNLSPLRERTEDIPLLVEHFFHAACGEMERQPRGLSREVKALLLDHEWRGNIREVMQVVRRLVALSEDGETITPELLPHDFERKLPQVRSGDEGAGMGVRKALRDEVAHLERRLIAEALEAVGWNRSEVARRLRISYPSLLAKIKRFGLRPRA
jgi:DNA-binding NtrC family response regulator/tetratricopeptide (TPR) repeat protein